MASGLLDGVVAVDGKTLRRSHDRANGGRASHLVSAWSTSDSVVLGQLGIEGKSNEITAIPLLLGMLELEGALVTLDAMGCQTRIAKRIKEKKADYLLSVKENQPSLCEAIGDAFLDAERERFGARFADYAEQSNAGHGRTEQRRCWVSQDKKLIESLGTDWAGLSRIVVIESDRAVAGKPSTSDRQYYISSRAETAEYFSGSSSVLLFVRHVDKDPAGRAPGFVFLGPVERVEDRGEKPIAITWRLRTPMPETWFRIARAAAG